MSTAAEIITLAGEHRRERHGGTALLDQYAAFFAGRGDRQLARFFREGRRDLAELAEENYADARRLREQAEVDGHVLDGPSVAEMAQDGDPLDRVTDAELDAGIKAAQHWQTVAEQGNRRSDARAYAQIVGLLWREVRVRRGWHAANNSGPDGRRKHIWFVCRDTPAGSYMPAEYHERGDGRLARFATFDAANRRAAALNGQPAPEPHGF